jgi:hypothetical protein
MSSFYKRAVSFEPNPGAWTGIRLPMPPRGELVRLSIQQQTGDDQYGFSGRLYDRRWGCERLADLHVQRSGQIDQIYDDGGFNVAFVDPQPDLQVGDVIQLKNTGVPAYDAVHHTIVEVRDPSTVITDCPFTVEPEISYAMWQELPWKPGFTPNSHLLLQMTGPANETYDWASTVNRRLVYANDDNQLATSRTPESALWLDFQVAGDGASTWLALYVCQQLKFFGTR